MKFSRDTIPFLNSAARQKRPDWLDGHQDEYERLVKAPFQALAEGFKANLQPLARGYHFPTKGIGRIKRPAHKVAGGEGQFKGWLSLSMSRPTGSRFERNPHLFFGILPNLPDWMGIIVSGGLFLPSHQQITRVRRSIAEDAMPYHNLFKSPAFRARFKTDFDDRLKMSRAPKAFAPDHPEIEWLKLKQFYVVKKLSVAEFTRAKLLDEITKDFTQLLRLNRLLEDALERY